MLQLIWESQTSQNHCGLVLVCPDCHDEIHNRFESNLWYATEAVIADKKYMRDLLDALARHHNDIPQLRKAIKELDKDIV